VEVGLHLPEQRQVDESHKTRLRSTRMDSSATIRLSTPRHPGSRTQSHAHMGDEKMRDMNTMNSSYSHYTQTNSHYDNRRNTRRSLAIVGNQGTVAESIASRLYAASILYAKTGSSHDALLLAQADLSSTKYAACLRILEESVLLPEYPWKALACAAWRRREWSNAADA
jgi:hypothetical protein